MNTMILIRGDKIAFPRALGSFGDDSHSAFDPMGTMVPMGWFIPCHEHGMQAIYMLDAAQLYKPHDKPLPHAANTGKKGVLVTLEEDGIQFHLVTVNDERRLILTPLITGPRGFSITTPYDHYGDLMAMAIRLTNTIEESVDMFCRHTAGHRGMVEIWDKKQVLNFMRENFVPYAQKRLELADGNN